MSRRDIETGLIRNVVARTDKLTYFGLNSVIRSILSAISFVIDETRYEIEQVKRKLYLLTARDKDLDDLASSRGVARRTDTVAAGVVLSVNFNNTATAEGTPAAMTLAKGMQIKSAETVVFETLNDVTIENGKPAQVVEAVALTEGSAGNVPAGSIIEGEEGANITNAVDILNSPPEAEPEKLIIVRNNAPAQGARDSEEPDHVFRDRAVHVVDLLNQGPPTFVEAQVLELYPEIRVGRTLAVRGIGSTQTITNPYANDNKSVVFNHVLVYAAKYNGLTFEPLELNKIKEKLEERMPAYVTVDVQNLKFEEIDVKATVIPLPNADFNVVKRDIGTNLTNFLDFTKWSFDDRNIGRSDLISIIDQTGGVDRVIIDGFEPLVDVAIGTYKLPKLTSLNISQYTSGA